MNTTLQLSPNEFHIIETANDHILFHTPTLQIYHCNNEAIVEYIQYCNEVKTEIDWSDNEMEEAKSVLLDLVAAAPPSVNVTLKRGCKYNFKTVVLPISGKCNLTCPYCFARTDQEFGFKDYSFEDIKKTIDYLYSQWDSKSKLQIVFFGGEPILNFPIITAAIQYVNEHYADWDVSYSITTNGTIVNKEIWTYIKQNNIGLLISLDGPDGNNNLRRYKNGKSSVEKVLKNIAILKSKNIPIQLRATLTNECENIVETYDFFENIGLPFSIVFAYKSGNKDHSLSDYDKNKLAKLNGQLSDLRSYYVNRIQNGLKVRCLTILDKLSQLKYRVIKPIHCLGGRNMFSIVDNGEIFSCEHLIHNKQYSIGNIHTDGIVQNRLNKFKSLPIKSIKGCAACMIRNLCNGGCFSEKLLCDSKITDRLNDDDCDLIRLQWEHIIQLYSRIQQACPDFFENNLKKAIV